jgi:hypothetical protein
MLRDLCQFEFSPFGAKVSRTGLLLDTLRNEMTRSRIINKHFSTKNPNININK